MTQAPFDTVVRYVDAFNGADVDAMASECADVMQILDGMAPHVWVGPTATRDWWSDVLTEGEHLGASGYRISLEEPRHVDVTDDCAYVVVPATMTFDLRGDRRTQTGSTFTVALRRSGGAWLIAAWSWSKGA
jgi:ketosteroid isomerase-like protein